MDVIYEFDGRNRMKNARGNGTFTQRDIFGNTQVGIISQEYAVMMGQARMVKSITNTDLNPQTYPFSGCRRED